jgi:hypothetical protein
VLGGDTLLNESDVMANASLLMRLLNRYGRLITVELPFSAKVVLAKTNFRIVGLGPRSDLTARVQIRNVYGSIHREVTARRVVEALQERRPRNPAATPQIPKIVERGSTWLVEEQIAGRHASKADLRRFIAGQLPWFYEGTVRPRPYRGPIPLPSLLAEARIHVPGLPATPPEGSWPVALCWADLSPSNLLCAADGKFWMIDWETSRVMAIALDLAKVCVGTPELTDTVLEIIGRFTPLGGVPPRLQLLLGLAGESVRRAWEFATRVADEVRLTGVSQTTARESQARHAAKIHALMRAIQAGSENRLTSA